MGHLGALQLLADPATSIQPLIENAGSMLSSFRDVSFFEYLEKIELYCSKENYNLGIFRELENFVLLF